MSLTSAALSFLPNLGSALAREIGKLHLHQQLQWRGLVKVRLKWVKNRGLDHIIDRETDLKAASLLKDAIKRSPTGFITARSLSEWQKHLGLTVPVLRFIRRYPTLFHEFPHSRYASLPCFRLTDTALLLDTQEESIHQAQEIHTVERLSRLLMMFKSKAIPFRSLLHWKWDLGLPDSFATTIVPKYPDHFRILKSQTGLSCLSLAQWRDEYALSALQKSNENAELSDAYRQFKRGKTALAFPMSFPRGYGAQNKVKAWMEDCQKLPYISPYEDSSQIDPNSDLMEKRVVGVLHELLSLTIHKKTKRNYLRPLREELNLPHRFTRIFTRYPGIFYLSLKCKTTTVALKEGYRRGKLADPHPLARIRDKYSHVMRTGVLYRATGVNLIPEKEGQINGEEVAIEESDPEEEGVETSDECYEEDISEDCEDD
ncbi:protein WHAT'S THIS FACTOR 9, mitochondrial-like [Macadamia integrifolia]|uniref:protein WHAT'S THIS FACTOR 9, mitochondrial-like n=1 Tax=Macadamia integrifolia TaxID=60698 RepID=UPI001C4FC3D4|nr:protein WHAT'S THIS FACTOR 9, mitochondrial-like [Macadamia integrifolia]XP_042513771.1 protein WHAT'S THIS FACTOR 9, mitochondrial-like [Macadamia integrifolia]